MRDIDTKLKLLEIASDRHNGEISQLIENARCLEHYLMEPIVALDDPCEEKDDCYDCYNSYPDTPKECAPVGNPEKFVSFYEKLRETVDNDDTIKDPLAKIYWIQQGLTTEIHRLFASKMAIMCEEIDQELGIDVEEFITLPKKELSDVYLNGTKGTYFDSGEAVEYEQNPVDILSKTPLPFGSKLSGSNVLSTGCERLDKEMLISLIKNLPDDMACDGNPKSNLKINIQTLPSLSRPVLNKRIDEEVKDINKSSMNRIEKILDDKVGDPVDTFIKKSEIACNEIACNKEWCKLIDQAVIDKLKIIIARKNENH
jgi:hypothetical protein